MKIKIDIELKVNNVVKYFVLSDLALMSGWGFISPLFSVFIIEKIAGATIATVGVATALYWVVRSVVQLPIADYLDKTEGERDDFYALIELINNNKFYVKRNEKGEKESTGTEGTGLPPGEGSIGIPSGNKTSFEEYYSELNPYKKKEEEE